MIDEEKLIEEIRLYAINVLRQDISEDEKIVKDDLLSDVIIKIRNQPKIGGLIPCSERLPEEGVEVLIWYEYFRYGDYNCMFHRFGIGYHIDGFWGGDGSGHKERCIAWQPLPESYKSE